MPETCPLNNLEKMLLATDGSEFSEGAIKEAISLAGQCSTKLIAMSAIVANEEFASEAPQVVEKAENEAREHLESVKARAAEAGVTCETVVHEGDTVHKLIIDEAKNDGAELIVMGRRGLSGIMKVAMGSVTARVIGHAPCNVLVVPRDCKLKFNTILVATDGSAHGNAAVAGAIKMAKKCDSSLIALSVASSEGKSEAASETVKQAAAAIEAAGIKAEAVTVTGKPYVKIVETAKERDVDLIVVGCHGGGGLAKLLMGSVTEKVIGNSSCSVMVVCGS
jgi:hypothetical protein